LLRSDSRQQIRSANQKKKQEDAARTHSTRQRQLFVWCTALVQIGFLWKSIVATGPCTDRLEEIPARPDRKSQNQKKKKRYYAHDQTIEVCCLLSRVRT
jgi:hypothetical protein